MAPATVASTGGLPLPQIFSPSADTWLRATLALVALAVIGVVLAGGGLAKSQYRTEVGLVKEQPVPFSHKHHVGELGIDCRYCHTGAETGAVAGLPPTHTCMTCHSQIWTDAPALKPVRESFTTGRPIRWQRVAHLPDYVYFDHHVHVENGVACVECHGRVDTMPLTWRAKPFTMGFCLDCHENPGEALRPPSMVTRMDWSEVADDQLARYSRRASAHKDIDSQRLTNCETCHR